jgi:hypothetical protein
MTMLAKEMFLLMARVRECGTSPLLHNHDMLIIHIVIKVSSQIVQKTSSFFFQCVVFVSAFINSVI